MKFEPIRTLLWPLIIIGMLTGCATRYTLTPADMSGIQGTVDLPDGAADRLILRVDNPGDQWLHLDLSLIHI